MNPADCTPLAPAVSISDRQYYEHLAALEQVDSGGDYRIAWVGPLADLGTAFVRICCTDSHAPESSTHECSHSEVIERADCADERTLARWCHAHGAGWVVRHHLLGRVLAMLQDRWGHAQEYMQRFDYAAGHGRAPLPPSFHSRAMLRGAQ